VSAVGVWGNPVALICRAADLAALPTSQLLGKASKAGVRSSFGLAAIVSINIAAMMLKDSDCLPPFMSRDELVGKCTARLHCTGIEYCIVLAYYNGEQYS
jgi:hypothetical protein